MTELTEKITIWYTKYMYGLALVNKPLLLVIFSIVCMYEHLPKKWKLWYYVQVNDIKWINTVLVPFCSFVTVLPGCESPVIGNFFVGMTFIQYVHVHDIFIDSVLLWLCFQYDSHTYPYSASTDYDMHTGKLYVHIFVCLQWSLQYVSPQF